MTLKITSKDSTEHAFLQKIEYEALHKDTISLQLEIQKIDELLKNKGYFLYQKKIEKKSGQVYTILYDLGFQVKFVHIYIPEEVDHPKRNDTLKLKTTEVATFLKNLTDRKDTEGRSFSEVSLKNLTLKNDILFATLVVKEQSVRTIDAVVVKGYENISKAVINYDLAIRKGAVFNKRKLATISQMTKEVSFIEEIKPPEVLFTKDSTILYIYLKKRNTNSFDGIVSFASNENNKGVLFNGNADLRLNNIFHGGEFLNIFWNSIGNEKQEFSLKTEVPYIFNTRISPQITFNLYKQDSVFLNTELTAKLAYKFSQRSRFSINYSTVSSNNLQEDITDNGVESYDQHLYGIGFQYKQQNLRTLNNDGFQIYAEALHGNRNSPLFNNSQSKFNIEFSNTFSLSSRASIYGRSVSGILISDNFLENEVYRIGGANSIRGFNEQSIFASRFSYVNVEYRYLTSQVSYLYSITDIGFVKTLDTANESLLGIGVGYMFTIKNSSVNLGYVLGKSSASNFDFNNSKVIINFRSYF